MWRNGGGGGHPLVSTCVRWKRGRHLLVKVGGVGAGGGGHAEGASTGWDGSGRVPTWKW